MYVDESGDWGLAGSPTRYVVLTGLVVHELRWKQTLDSWIVFRRAMRTLYGLRLRDEIHSGGFISHPGPTAYVPRHHRLAILRALANQIASMGDLTLINVLVDKARKTLPYDAFEVAWSALIQRFENTITHRNFNGPANPDERGMIFPDHTDDKKLTALVRRLRHYNPVPSRYHDPPNVRNLPIVTLIEDPNFRESDHSYFIQAVDCAAYLLYQFVQPNSFMKKHGGHLYFKKLAPVLCKVAAQTDPWGIVRL
jgi:hypothetical protein